MWLQMALVMMAVGVAGVFAIVAYQRYRRSAEAYFQRRAKACFDEGDLPGSLRYLMKAESMWGFNSSNGSPASMAKDLDRLRKIVERESDALCALGTAGAADSILEAVDSLQRFFENRENFGIDGRSIRRQRVYEFLSLKDALNRERLTLRALVERILGCPKA